MSYNAYVTILGEFEDGNMDFLDLYMNVETDDFDEARRFYDSTYVVPFGVLANTLHANHPEFVRIEADYDIEDSDNPDSMAWYYIESIWYED